MEDKDLSKRIEELEKENEDLKNQVEFYKSAYKEQLRNALTLANELEEALKETKES